MTAGAVSTVVVVTWRGHGLIGRCLDALAAQTRSHRVLVIDNASATVLLLPDRYAAAGQMTQRLVEAVLAGCLPLTPTSIRSAGRYTPPLLHVDDGAAVASMITRLKGIAGTSEHVELIAGCLRSLEMLRVSRQLDVLDNVLAKQPARRMVAS